MKIRALVLPTLVGLMFAQWAKAQNSGVANALPTPGFHRLHLNSMNPDAATTFYMKQFPSSAETTVAGFPELKAGKVYMLFSKVTPPPPTDPQTAT